MKCKAMRKRLGRLIASSGLLLILLLSTFFNTRFEAQARTIVVPDDFSSIQAAINNASAGDTILVHNGTYHENIIINKAIRLIGEASEATIIDGGKISAVITVSSIGVYIEGFTIRNSSLGFPNSGIRVIGVWQCILVNNIITGNFVGILLDSAPYNQVYKNMVSGNHYGVYIASSFNNEIANNIINNNWVGIVLAYSTENVIHSNQIQDSANVGISLTSSRDNSFYYNNIVNNAFQAYVKETNYANVWDKGYPSGGNYWSDYTGQDLYSGPYQNQSGSDGVGDTPYIINSANKDRFPHVKLVEVFHDVAVKKIELSATKVYEGESIRIEVTVANYGNYSESFDVTVYYNETVIATKFVRDLGERGELILDFFWNTTGVPTDASYIIKAEVSTVLGETNLENNVMSSGFVSVRPYRLWAIRIVQLTPSDETGQPTYSFAKGSIAHFKITINNTSADFEVILVTVNVYDAMNFTLGIVSFQGLISPGSSVFILGLPIPSATIGYAKVYANAFTNWPHLGGLPYGQEVAATFQIKG